MTTFQPQLDVLPTAQRALWPSLRAATELGFVLYGGTSIALRLGHRRSVDFDFFTEQPFVPSELRTRLASLATGELRQSAPNTLTVAVTVPGETQTVSVSFFGGLTFGRVGEPAQSSDGVVLAASLDDLLASKLKTLLDRVEAKDYKDIAALLRSGIPLSRGLAAARSLYGSAFDPMIALRAATWFEEGELASVSESDRVALRVAAAAVRAPLPDVPRASDRLTTA